MGSQEGVLVGLNLSRQTKVRKLYLVILREENVCRFEITMDDILAVKCDHSISYLLEKLLSFEFGEGTPRLQIVLEVATLANLKDEVVGVFGLLVAVELDDVPVLHSVQHGDLLAEELLHVMLSDLSHVNLFHSHGNLFELWSWTALVDTICLQRSSVYLSCHARPKLLIHKDLQVVDLFFVGLIIVCTVVLGLCQRCRVIDHSYSVFSL